MNGMERRVARSLPTVDLPLGGKVGDKESKERGEGRGRSRREGVSDMEGDGMLVGARMSS